MSLTIVIGVAVLGGFVGGRIWGESYPRPWPTNWVRFRCRVLGHRWHQPEGVFTARRCRRCDKVAA